MKLSKGRKFGKLTVSHDMGTTHVFCTCSCGNSRTCSRKDLLNDVTTMCLECFSKRGAFEVGQKFGSLTVLEDRGSRQVLCRCSCGSERAYDRGNLERATKCDLCRRKALSEVMQELNRRIAAAHKQQGKDKQ